MYEHHKSLTFALEHWKHKLACHLLKAAHPIILCSHHGGKMFADSNANPIVIMQLPAATELYNIFPCKPCHDLPMNPHSAPICMVVVVP